MTDIIQGFDSLLLALENFECRDEGSILLLEKMIHKDRTRIEKLISRFDTSEDDGLKEILAALIVKVDKGSRYREYLKAYHDWTADDFDDVK